MIASWLSLRSFVYARSVWLIGCLLASMVRWLGCCAACGAFACLFFCVLGAYVWPSSDPEKIAFFQQKKRNGRRERVSPPRDDTNDA